MSFDQWMNVCGLSGISLYLLAWWWRLKIGIGESFVAQYMNRAMRFFGLLLILTPLFLRWYLSEGLILFCSIAFIVVGCIVLLNRRK
jgi:hypothetical protein